MNKKISIYKDIFSAFVAVVCLLSMYIFPEVIKLSVTKSLHICGSSLIPSLFPFITCTRICAELIMRLCKSSSRRVIPILNVSTGGLIIFALGLVSGFPSGAVLAGSAYSSGAITKNEAQRITAFSNSVSPSFCIMVFGESVMRNKLCGFTVLSAIIIVNIICFILSGLVSSDKINSEQHSDLSKAPIYKKTGISTIISDSYVIMLNICAFVTFFFCLGNIICKAISLYFDVPAAFSAMIYSLLEISGGIGVLGELPFGQKLLYGSMLLGFGGISAIMQVCSVCDKFGLSAKNFIVSKIISAITAPFITAALSHVFSETMYEQGIFKSNHSLSTHVPILMFVSVFLTILCSVAFIIILRYKDYKKSKFNF